MSSPDIDPGRSIGFPLTVTVGMPCKILPTKSESIVGSSEDAVANHDPSTNRTEFPPTRERSDRVGKIVTEEVRPLRSTTNGSSGLETPST